MRLIPVIGLLPLLHPGGVGIIGVADDRGRGFVRDFLSVFRHDLEKPFEEIMLQKGIPEAADGEVIGERTGYGESAETDERDPVLHRLLSRKVLA
jgi:hypothetical protein